MAERAEYPIFSRLREAIRNDSDQGVNAAAVDIIELCVVHLARTADALERIATALEERIPKP